MWLDEKAGKICARESRTATVSRPIGQQGDKNFFSQLGSAVKQKLLSRHK